MNRTIHLLFLSAAAALSMLALLILPPVFAWAALGLALVMSPPLLFAAVEKRKK